MTNLLHLHKKNPGSVVIFGVKIQSMNNPGSKGMRSREVSDGIVQYYESGGGSSKRTVVEVAVAVV